MTRRPRRSARVPGLVVTVAAAIALAFVLPRLQAAPSEPAVSPATLAVMPSASATEGAPSAAPSPSASPAVSSALPSPTQASRGYLVTVDELRDRAARAAAGEEPYASAVADLVEWARRAVDDRPRPVESLRIKGTGGPFVRDARRAYGLALAYVVTGDESYAAAARATILAWVQTMKATRDTCPDSGACQTSLVIGRTGAGFAMAADLLRGSGAWAAVDDAMLAGWLRQRLLPAVSVRPNNWGDAGLFLRVVAADFSGDRSAFASAIRTWRSFVDLIHADGDIPEESRRGHLSIMYTQEALQYKVAVAVIAERHGIDLWNYRGEAGGSLKQVLDRLARYWTRPADWPPYPNADVPDTGPVWELAYAHWRDADWKQIVADGRPYGDEGHSAIAWTTLTNGVPL